jgi:hypothetical protein
LNSNDASASGFNRRNRLSGAFFQGRFKAMTGLLERTAIHPREGYADVIADRAVGVIRVATGQRVKQIAGQDHRPGSIAFQATAFRENPPNPP